MAGYSEVGKAGGLEEAELRGQRNGRIATCATEETIETGTQTADDSQIKDERQQDLTDQCIEKETDWGGGEGKVRR